MVVVGDREVTARAATALLVTLPRVSIDARNGLVYLRRRKGVERMKMRALVGAAVAFVIGVATQEAHAAYGWTSVGVRAEGLGVGAGDAVWIIGYPSGHVFYYGTVCSTFLCVPGWVDTGGPPGLAELSVNLNGDAFAFANGKFWYWRWDTTPGSWRALPASTSPSGIYPCSEHFAVSYVRPTGVSTQYFPFKPPALTGSQSQTIADIWGSGCGYGLEHWPINLTFANRFSGGWHWDTTQWSSADYYDDGTGVVNPTMFSADDGFGDGFQQSLWIMGGGSAWASVTPNESHPVGSSRYVHVAKPKIGTRSYNVTYLTDHYVIAGNKVFRWDGDLFGSTIFGYGWTYITDAPAGTTLAKIAHAPPLYGTAQGDIGPSHLWAYDNQFNLYEYVDLGSPPG